ncbi:cytochrome c [Roseimicrobium gellanilyticum]|uniref:Cytochrome c n=1 Tax=Roseimicrobium gellanilyticum TaxID=748857 RepID=A0A366HNZ7_9BACT|nr:PSD1 and planctomycete cytochrome C domain-containing protein [Roseimicrobium gellanilyticum]RBP45240.1 cytochrome c [Roseimicrobium gellanilyticum]
MSSGNNLTSAPRRVARLLLPLVSLAGMASHTRAEDAASVAFFESKIRPVLVEHCYECHSTETGKSKGGLLLDTKHGIRSGGETGPAVVPGDPTKSLLLTAVKHADPDLEMPPKKPKLSDRVIADLEAWIKSGANDPRETAARTAALPPVSVEEGRKFWSYQKPVVAPSPKTKDTDWATRDLDHFVLARLEAEGMTPSPDAEPVVLLRRLHFDLVGLPPTPAETEFFVQRWNKGGEEREKLLGETVDRLLGSPHFGERWGKHWLDVARFAESNGRESNITFPHAWRYRDYVIRAMNEGKPFDRFVTEQIAGDLLPAKDDAARAQLLVATGFLAFGAKGLNEMSKAQFAADLADEQLDTVTRAIMASSVACARCHDHKTEPFSMEDYYALAGVFKSTKTHYGTWIDSENNNGGTLLRLPELPGQLVPNKPGTPQEVARLKADLAQLAKEGKDQEAYVMKANLEGKDLSGEFNKLLGNAIRIYWQSGGLEGRLATMDEKGRALPLCMGVEDAEKIQDAALLERGEIAHPGKTIRRGFPKVMEMRGVSVPDGKSSGRLEFARWLTSPEHPLTSRVMVNRVWRHLLGAGLVKTTDNFGFSGERPSHQELLDSLAVKFTDGGWSVKALIREIALSRTYRQASTYRDDCFHKDPENRLLWRAGKRRLDAEVIRDSMLSVSGLLDPSPRAGSLVAELDNHSVSLIGFNKKVPEDLDGSRRRSVYLPVLRDALPDAMELFDAAEPSLVIGDRSVTNVPLQALYLLNGAFVQEQAAALAARVAKAQKATEARIREAFLLCFNRAPDPKEMEIAKHYFETAGTSSDAPAEDALLASYCQALLATAEFRNAD